MKIEKYTTYSYSLGLDLSFDTHIDDLLTFFQNVHKSLFMLRKVNKHENKKTNNIFLLPEPRPFIKYPY